MNAYKTLKEISQNIGVNYSTLRGYAERFSGFLPTRKVEGVRWAVYEPEAEDILKLVASLYAEGHRAGAVREALKTAGYSEFIDHEAVVRGVDEGIDSIPPNTTLMLGSDASHNLMLALSQVNQVQEQTIRQQRAIIIDLQTELDTLKSSQSATKERIQALEQQVKEKES